MGTIPAYLKLEVLRAYPDNYLREIKSNLLRKKREIAIQWQIVKLEQIRRSCKDIEMDSALAPIVDKILEV